jgi:hypothetical protein
VQKFHGDPLVPGLYTVSATLLNQENISFFASLNLQAQFFALAPSAGSYSGSADVNFLNTVQLTQIGIDDGTNTFTNFSLIGASQGTDYQQVLTESDATPEPGSMALMACGAGLIAWLKRRP